MLADPRPSPQSHTHHCRPLRWRSTARRQHPVGGAEPGVRPLPPGLRDPPWSPPTQDADRGPAPPPRALPLRAAPAPRASWVGPGRLQKPPAAPAGPSCRRPSRPRPSHLPPPAADPPDSEAPGRGAGGTPPPGHPPGSEPPAGPKSSPRPQSLRRAAAPAAAAAAAATAGRRGRRSGRRDELVGRRGKKVLRLFRCLWEPKARGPQRAALLREAGPEDPRQQQPPPPPRTLAPSLPPIRHSPGTPIPDEPSGTANPTPAKT